LIKKGLAFTIIVLFVATVLTPIGFSNNIKVNEKETLDEKNCFKSFHDSEIADYGPIPGYECKDFIDFKSEEVNILKETSKPLNGPPIDSPWPMYCHDVRHTGRSPYSTADNPGVEKWRFDTIDVVTGSSVIDNDGNIYIGSRALYAVYPNGTLKWKYFTNYHIESAPAIDENGVIYFGTVFGNPYLFAVYTNNGTLKWKYFVGNSIFSSPAVGDDGTIYFGDLNNNINALCPNGTLKWKYATGNYVLSSPAIGDDGTIYCGSIDYNLYALYPDNGTLKWKFETGYYVRVSPCIADDGIIYCVSRDGYLYAIYPNGTMKWQTYVHAGTSPTIGWDGTIYAGWKDLYAIDPVNGSIKWIFDPGEGRNIEEGTPCGSVDGTIYFGTCISYSTQPDGGEIIAVNPDGTEHWRIHLANGYIMSAPAIGSDGTVYVGSWNDGTPPYDWGYLHAIGLLDQDAPSAPIIDGPESGRIKKTYSYTFKSTSPLGRDVYYYIDWDDHTSTKWAGPYSSGEKTVINHSWLYKRNFTIQVRAKDTENLWGPCSTFEIKISNNKIAINLLLLRFLEQFPMLERLFQIPLHISF